MKGLRSFFVSLMAGLALSLWAGAATADLLGRDIDGSPVDADSPSAVFIYDSAFDITWLRDANFARTSGYDADGRMYWAESMQWAAQLQVGRFDDWRLPAASTWLGYDDVYSEMGHLIIGELQNTDSLKPLIPGPFQNFDNGFRWTGTEYPGGLFVYYFDVASRWSSVEPGTLFEAYSFAVRDGDVAAAVPEPATLVLFAVGVALLGGVAWRRRC